MKPQNKIQVLSEDIANKIAAGEVIERPSSIVKELIENSLDAGATSIEIEVKNGGRSLIRIADNGSGIARADLEKAFLRHGTSKISKAKDLVGIDSFGFRGEALPSIAAVSRVEMMTRTQKDSVGTLIQIDGGKTMALKESPCAEGTVMQVKDLFFNTPARRKFLRTDTTELGHISDVVSNFAFSHPQVRIVFKSSNRTLLDLPPVKNVLDRAEAVLGPDIVPHLLEMDGEANGIHIWGLIAKPLAARANRTGQTFFINQRWVKSISLSYGLQAGYHGLLMHGQYPVAVVFIDVDLESVDVNVHPTKQEVRLSRESEVKSLMKKIVAEALGRTSDLSPDLKPFKTISQKTYVDPSPGKEKTDPVSVYAQELRTSEKESVVTQVSEPPQETFAPSSKEVQFEAPVQIRDAFGITKILGQIHHTFIVAETEEGLIIIDQHAAHERIMYEQVIQEMKSGKPAKQSLLMDEVLDLHTRQVEVLQKALPFLEKIGFDIEPFGETSFVVRAYPVALRISNLVDFLRGYIEELEAGKTKTKLSDRMDDVAALIACKSRSVRAHDVLTPLQLKALIERLSVCENPFSCPHGRPAFFKKSFSELEKEFKRK